MLWNFDPYTKIISLRIFKNYVISHILSKFYWWNSSEFQLFAFTTSGLRFTLKRALKIETFINNALKIKLILIVFYLDISL